MIPQEKSVIGNFEHGFIPHPDKPMNKEIAKGIAGWMLKEETDGYANIELVTLLITKSLDSKDKEISLLREEVEKLRSKLNVPDDGSIMQMQADALKISSLNLRIAELEGAISKAGRC
mgnify:CR=1 FL=1